MLPIGPHLLTGLTLGFGSKELGVQNIPSRVSFASLRLSPIKLKDWFLILGGVLS